MTTGATLFVDCPVFITPVVAQTQAELKAKADRLLDRGVEQYRKDRFQEAL